MFLESSRAQFMLNLTPGSIKIELSVIYSVGADEKALLAFIDFASVQKLMVKT